MLWVRLFQSIGLCNFGPTMIEHFGCSALGSHHVGRTCHFSMQEASFPLKRTAPLSKRLHKSRHSNYQARRMAQSNDWKLCPSKH
ncbi:unnamed protein product [Callosobruchus maculatus]|uniref:Uncharacterized protein n=1 Tax=Callosobruchus maculatus TaxID=64391 RepID=A0A653BUH1_CALMS|nr:unnamed protein product [Callosobruchus maculatus]